MNLATLAAALNAAGTTLSEAGALPALVVPDQPPPTRHVDCGPCTACCHMAVFVGPWDTEEYELQPGTTILARRPETGACVYLDPQTGCTIYSLARCARSADFS